MYPAQFIKSTSSMDQTQKILLVEDNDFVRMQIKKFLDDAGYVVAEATQGDEALNMIDETYDLAIVDVRMEPVDGFEFIRTIRADDLKTPVILVTGDQNPDLLAQSNKLGVSTVLMKPVQKDRLISMVARTISMAKR